MATLQQPPVQWGQRIQTVTVAGAYTVDSGQNPDGIVLCNLGSAAAITLPANTLGRVLYFVDIGGAASTKNITLTPAAGQINGGSTYVLNLNRAAIGIVGDGTNWWVFAEYNGTVI
jgi:hypothetical protein